MSEERSEEVVARSSDDEAQADLERGAVEILEIEDDLDTGMHRVNVCPKP